MSPQTSQAIIARVLPRLAWIVFPILAGLLGLPAPAAAQAPPPDQLHLRGVVYDFSSSHPDFGVTDLAAMGQYAGNVGGALGPGGLPVFTGNGQHVMSQWFDKHGNPIAPYPGPGLPFGHFDVDVYDAPSTSELYHEHEFDDQFDITYIDIANDPNLLFASVVGSAYPNDLRLEFLNPHNGGGGTYVFEAGAGVQTGTTADGFTVTFTPALLTQLRVNFVALAALRATQPGNSQGDAIDRDDSFAVRLYDVVTNALVYEVAAYHHDQGPIDPEVDSGSDACGSAIADTIGSFGGAGTGAVTDAASFNTWFRNEMGMNLSTTHTLVLDRGIDGVYEYLTDSFYPIDRDMMGNEGQAHNNFFSYTFSASFVYNQCTDQFFEFAGNDDAWVFIDGKMAMDLGGTATPSGQHVSLDRLNLVDGETYELKFFYAHRRDAGNSLFHMRVNFPLYTSGVAAVSAGFD